MVLAFSQFVLPCLDCNTSTGWERDKRSNHTYSVECTDQFSGGLGRVWRIANLMVVHLKQYAAASALSLRRLVILNVRYRLLFIRYEILTELTAGRATTAAMSFSVRLGVVRYLPWPCRTEQCALHKPVGVGRCCPPCFSVAYAVFFKRFFLQVALNFPDPENKPYTEQHWGDDCPVYGIVLSEASHFGLVECRGSTRSGHLAKRLLKLLEYRSSEAIVR